MYSFLRRNYLNLQVFIWGIFWAFETEFYRTKQDFRMVEYCYYHIFIIFIIKRVICPYETLLSFVNLDACFVHFYCSDTLSLFGEYTITTRKGPPCWVETLAERSKDNLNLAFLFSPGINEFVGFALIEKK